jgi:hypothetical protein
MKRHSDANWLCIQIDFAGHLDEAFSFAANKQGIRPKDYVLNDLSTALDAEISALREQIKNSRASRLSAAMAASRVKAR